MTKTQAEGREQAFDLFLPQSDQNNQKGAKSKEGKKKCISRQRYTTAEAEATLWFYTDILTTHKTRRSLGPLSLLKCRTRTLTRQLSVPLLWDERTADVSSW